MTTNADYKAARDDFNTHVAQHKCKPRECSLRLALWEHMIRVADRLGKDR